jgi:hypothetical protein
MGRLSVKEPIGTKYFLTPQRTWSSPSEPIGFLFMSNPILQPRRLRDLLLPNRVVMAPLTRGRASNSGHLPNDLMREYFSLAEVWPRVMSSKFFHRVQVTSTEQSNLTKTSTHQELNNPQLRRKAKLP